MVLFAIIDILGSIPIILNIKRKGQTVHAFRASAVALFILIGFLFSGEGVLRLFSVDIQSFAVAGALIIFIFSLEMILDVEIFRNQGPSGGSSNSFGNRGGSTSRIASCLTRGSSTRRCRTSRPASTIPTACARTRR